MNRAKVDIFYAISDRTRRQILECLAAKECTATELAEPHRMSQPAISQHLRVLREAKLVSAEQRGRERYYRLEPSALRPIVDWLSFYERFWTSRLHKLKNHLDRLP